MAYSGAATTELPGLQSLDDCPYRGLKGLVWWCPVNVYSRSGSIYYKTR
jgi:hypothetical protein